MSPWRTWATARRVSRQLRHDPRGAWSLLLGPALLAGLLAWTLQDAPQLLDRWGGPLLAVGPMIWTFVFAGLAMQQERHDGTLERLLSTPVAKLEVFAGYAIALLPVITVQVFVLTALLLGPFGLELAGPPRWILGAALANALLGATVGLLVGAILSPPRLLRFLPAVVFPQLVIAGILLPRSRMPPVLQWVSAASPLSYAVDAIAQLRAYASVTTALRADLGVVLTAALAAVVLGAGLLRRRTP